MKISSAKLLELAALPVEAIPAALTFLAEQLAEDEARRAVTATRQKRYRDAHVGVTVTQQQRENDVSETLLARDGDIISKNSTLELSLPPSIPPSPPETPFWRDFIEAYPKREGGMDEAAAEKGFAAACRRTDPQVIIAGAKAYHAEMSKQQKIGTQFILKPRKWLNDCGWTNYQPKAVTPIQPRVTVFEGTPAWEAHKRANPRLTARDIKDEHGRFIGRGWYFPTEYPEERNAA